MQEHSSWLRGYISAAEQAQMNRIAVNDPQWSTSGLADLVIAWFLHVQRFETDLEPGVDDRSVWVAHDYVAALIIRDMIAQCMGQVPEHLRPGIAAAIENVDQRFRVYAEPDSRGYAERVEGSKKTRRGWWWNTIPRRGPIRDDMLKWWGPAHSRPLLAE